MAARNLGIQSINIPDFYLGLTEATAPTTVNQPRAQISIPDGINSLRFGGVDTTAFFGTDPAQSLPLDGLNDSILINLGIPTQIGTSIVVNTSPAAISRGSQAASYWRSVSSPGNHRIQLVSFGICERRRVLRCHDAFRGPQRQGRRVHWLLAVTDSGHCSSRGFRFPLSRCRGCFRPET